MVVDDELRSAVEHVDQPDRAVRTDQGVSGSSTIGACGAARRWRRVHEWRPSPAYEVVERCRQVCWSATGGRALVVCSVTVPPGSDGSALAMLTREGSGIHRVPFQSSSVQRSSGLPWTTTYPVFGNGCDCTGPTGDRRCSVPRVPLPSLPPPPSFFLLSPLPHSSLPPPSSSPLLSSQVFTQTLAGDQHADRKAAGMNRDEVRGIGEVAGGPVWRGAMPAATS